VGGESKKAIPAALLMSGGEQDDKEYDKQLED
jgi:hypothetical protein